MREDGSGEVEDEPPFDNRIPDHAAVVSGNTIKLTCPVSAIPPPQITWYKNGQELRVEHLDERYVLCD